VEQVAESLALPQGTVKSRLSRAREALRRQLLAVAQASTETGRNRTAVAIARTGGNS
jgi:hypothetical protein